MTTKVLEKTEIKTTWEITEIQKLTAKAFTNNMMATMGILRKQGEEAMKEFQAATRAPMITYYKELGVKTPIELAKAKAEYETNLFGSKIEIHGDEKEAHVKYLNCAIWDNMKCGMSKEQEQEMGMCFAACVSAFAEEFGFTGEVKFENEIATVTFKTK